MYLTHSHLSCSRCQRLHLSVKVFNGELGLFTPIPPSWVKLQSPGRNYYLLLRRLTRPQPLFCGDLLEIAWDCLRLLEIVTRPLPLSQAKVTSMQSNIFRPCLRFCSTVICSSNTTSTRQASRFPYKHISSNEKKSIFCTKLVLWTNEIINSEFFTISNFELNVLH